MKFETDVDIVKITVVYYTKLAMMGKEKMRTYVDMRLFVDVENMDYFISLDWENILWERTFSRLQ